MALPKLYAIYLNNLRWFQIQNLHKKYIKESSAKLKIDRINELIAHFDELPDDEMIRQYLFAGRVSIAWYTLKDLPKNTIAQVAQKMREINTNILERPAEPELEGEFKIIHGLQADDRLLITMGMAGYREHIITKNYELESIPSEYFAHAIIRNSRPVLEIRGNDTLRATIARTIESTLGIEFEDFRVIHPLTQDQFMSFKTGIPGSAIRKYKGRSTDAATLTEVFDLTARLGKDYAADLNEFNAMRATLDDLSLTISFDYAGSSFSFRLNLLTRSLYFPAFVSEDAIDYILEIFRATILEN